MDISDSLTRSQRLKAVARGSLPRGAPGLMVPSESLFVLTGNEEGYYLPFRLDHSPA